MATSSVTIARCQRGQDRYGGILPGHDVGERHSHLHRRAAGLARYGHPPALGLDHVVITGSVALGSEAGNGAPDQSGALREGSRGRETVAFESAALEVVDRHIGVGQKRGHE
jgi:hypothetical protein